MGGLILSRKHALEIENPLNPRPNSEWAPQELAQGSGSLGILDKLPVELHLMIFAQVEDVITIVCLSITHSIMFEVGRSALISRLLKGGVDWRGERLIFLGEYARHTELPHGVFSEREIGEIQSASQELDFTCLCDWLVGTFGDPPIENGLPCIYDADFFEGLKQMGATIHWSEHDLRRLLHLLELQHRLALTYDSEHPWVLCNLTKGEYVRADAIADLDDSAGGDKKPPADPFVKVGQECCLTLGHVLMLKTCWSTDSPFFDYEGEVHRGVWAGHRFEVTTVDRLVTLPGGMEWRDVSEEAIQQAVAAFTIEYGEDWKDLT